MENKYAGYLILGVSALVIVIILLFNSALKEIIVNSCGLEHSLVCPMNQTVNQQTYIAFGVVGLLVIVGFILIFSKPQKEIIFKNKFVEKKTESKKTNLNDLTNEEKNVAKIINENKAIFQAELIERTGFGKAKITRILDRLEGRGLVERKRRGMTNVVVWRN